MSEQPSPPGKGLDEKPQPSLYEPFYLHVQRQGSSLLPTSPSTNGTSGGLLGKIGWTLPRLDVDTTQDILYVRPAPGDLPGEDELLKGTVSLFLPKPRRLKSLEVRLLGRYDISWPSGSGKTPYENGVVFERAVNLLGDKEGVELEKGSHGFEFLFFVPASIPCWERSHHGRVRYSLVSTARLSSPLGSSDLTSPPKPFYVLPSPSPSPTQLLAPPPPLQIHAEGHFPSLGPWAIEVQSQHATVGGLLLAKLILPAASTSIFLHSIKVSIVQSFWLTSPVDSTRQATVPEAYHTVFILDSSYLPNSAQMRDNGRGSTRRNLSTDAEPLTVLSEGKEASIVHLARLHNDNFLRPTTREGTDTPIRVGHRVEMEVLYRRATMGEVKSWIQSEAGTGAGGGQEEENMKEKERSKSNNRKGKEREVGQDVDAGKDKELQKLKMSKPIELYSCLNFLDSLTLPKYATEDPHPILQGGDGGVDLKVPCVCGMTLKELLSKHASLLLPPPVSSSSEPGPTGLASPSQLDLLPPTLETLHSSASHDAGQQHRLKPEEERAALSPAGVSFDGRSQTPTSGGWDGDALAEGTIEGPEEGWERQDEKRVEQG
ncbi:hypothetical protein JCM11641_003985 [Rhodosporidiobolus odoratus]